MIPAIISNQYFEFMGIAVATKQERLLNNKKSALITDDVCKNSIKKAKKITEQYGGCIFDSYEKLLTSNDIDAVYIALPPALHYLWAKKAVINNKHIIVEKPFGVSFKETQEIINIAKENNLAVLENFAFVYHKQIEKIKEIISSGKIGEIRYVKSNFGFPIRELNDFRYSKELGGGALLDCGCYALKMAQLIMGNNLKIKNTILYSVPKFEVDMYGAISAVNEKNIIADLLFGMDQQYNCALEIWGSKGCIKSPRIYTPPADYTVNLDLTIGNENHIIPIEPFDQFWASLNVFADLTNDINKREKIYNDIISQSYYLEQCKIGGNNE